MYDLITILLRSKLTTLEVVLLLLLDLQLFGQLKQDAVNQFVVFQLVFRTDPDAAEDLIMDVSVQSIHQLRS